MSEPSAPATSSTSNVIVSPSKALPFLFTQLRNVKTSSEQFVRYAKRIMTIVAEDALAEFPQTTLQIATPCCPNFPGTFRIPADQICAVSIIRSGDALLESVRAIEPAVRVGKILIQRNEDTAVPTLYYSKLPPNIHNLHVLLCDPMLATGGSALLALQVLVTAGCPLEHIVFCTVICAPEGIQAIQTAYPTLKLVTGVIDTHLNGAKYIVPGLGDYGDRFFNT